MVESLSSTLASRNLLTRLVPILKIPNKRPFFISFYLSLYFLYLFRALSFGMVFFLQLASQQTLEQETPEDTYKILFNSYDAPRCLQTMAYIFFLFLIFHIEHECHFDSIELEKNPPISKLEILISKKHSLWVRCVDMRTHSRKLRHPVQRVVRHR